ncbi:MAG: biopolymer transporter ExbD [Pseudomonadota bacterium]
MRTSHANRHAEAKVDLTPMLDVVFILLIFFIVTSNFIQEETLGLEGPPPPGPGAETPSAIMVYVDQDNLIRVNGRLTQIGGVRANLERLRAESPESVLIIQAHANTPSGTVIRLRDLAYSANVERVNIVRGQEG